MNRSVVWKGFAIFSLVVLFLGLNFGVLAAHSYTGRGNFGELLSFINLRPLHVTSVMLWILVGATAVLYWVMNELHLKYKPLLAYLQLFCWIVAYVGIFISYLKGQFGGREYWEFPPVWSLPIFIAWCIMVYQYFSTLQHTDKSPVYIWMFGTGLTFFVFVFLENYLWAFDVFRADFVKDTTLQWKVNGSLVGCWNQMIYGASFFLMEKISGNKSIARSKMSYFMYFLGLFNLMFNWSHHIYTLPTEKYIRYVGYLVSMTEWVIFLRIIWTFRSTIESVRKHRNLISYRFLIAADVWVFLNLFMALLMSVPAINLYTHGTHITVAHAMGTTIGINSMILLGVMAFALNCNEFSLKQTQLLSYSFWLLQFSLLFFWFSLIYAGIVKTMLQVSLPQVPHRYIMKQSVAIFKVFNYSGSIMLIGFTVVLFVFIKRMSVSEPKSS